MMGDLDTGANSFSVLTTILPFASLSLKPAPLVALIKRTYLDWPHLWYFRHRLKHVPNLVETIGLSLCSESATQATRNTQHAPTIFEVHRMV